PLERLARRARQALGRRVPDHRRPPSPGPARRPRELLLHVAVVAEPDRLALDQQRLPRRVGRPPGAVVGGGEPLALRRVAGGPPRRPRRRRPAGDRSAGARRTPARRRPGRVPPSPRAARGRAAARWPPRPARWDPTSPARRWRRRARPRRSPGPPPPPPPAR